MSGISKRWLFTMRTIPDISSLFKPLEEKIRECLIREYFKIEFLYNDIAIELVSCLIILAKFCNLFGCLCVAKTFWYYCTVLSRMGFDLLTSYHFNGSTLHFWSVFALKLPEFILNLALLRDCQCLSESV